MKKSLFLIAVAVMFVSVNLHAQRAADIEGGKDYPLVSRFKGSIIQWSDHKSFDKYYLMKKHDNKLIPKQIEGEIHRIQYSAGKAHSIAEISNSYETALRNAGFNILLTLDERNSPGNLNEKLYFGEFNGLNQLPSGSVKPDHDGKWFYMEAKGQNNNKDVFVVIFITSRGRPLITFDAVEVKKIETGLVTARKMDRRLSSEGHISLTGIFFDTGRSTIKSESDKALKNIADYLNSHPGKKFLVVGHTDNIGEFDSNLKLSAARANAVVNALTMNYNVDSGQLTPFGTGSAAPVATNSTEEGKAKNRRVELVEK
jgi:OOP family OmpA-OmpF porin